MGNFSRSTDPASVAYAFAPRLEDLGHLMIRFSCPACQKILKVSDHGAGRKVPCPRCGQRLLIPPPVQERNKTVLGQPVPDVGASFPSPPSGVTPSASGLPSAPPSTPPNSATQQQPPTNPSDPGSLLLVGLVKDDELEPWSSITNERTQRNQRDDNDNDDAHQEWPAFDYALFPSLAPFRRVVFHTSLTGTLTQVTRTVYTSVEGGGGGGGLIFSDRQGHIQGAAFGSADISTRHDIQLDLWIVDDHGKETSLRLKDDIPLKEGHVISIVDAYRDNHTKGSRCLILNHTAKETHFFRNCFNAIRPSREETLIVCLIITAGFLCAVLPFVCGILTKEHYFGPVFFLTAFGFFPIFLILLYHVTSTRKSGAEHRLRLHCLEMARQRLNS